MEWSIVHIGRGTVLPTALFETCKNITTLLPQAYAAGYEEAISTDDQASFADFDLDCDSVDACTKDCLISGSRSVIPATFVLIAALIARFL